MRNIWKYISRLGVSKTYRHLPVHDQILSNQLNFIIVLIMAALVAASFLNNLLLSIRPIFPVILIFPMIMAGVSAINLRFNYYRHFRVSRAVLMFAPLLILLVFPVILFQAWIEYLFWYMLVPVPALLLPLLFYDVRKDKWSFIAATAYVFLFMLFSIDLLKWFSVDPELNRIIESTSIFLRLVPTSVGIFTFFVVSSLRTKNQVNLHRVKYQSDQLFSTVAELKNMQQHLIEQEKMAMLGRMSSELTHEINTPISAIKGNLSLIVTDAKTTKKLWSELLNVLSREEHKKLVELTTDAIGVSGKIYIHEEREKLVGRIRNDLMQLTIPQERWEEIISYFTEIGLPSLLPYQSILLHDRYKDLMEIVYCEQNIFHSASISHDAIGKAELLIKRLKSYTYMQSTQEKKPFMLNDLVETSVSLLNNKLIDIKLHILCDEHIPMVMGYPDEMMQVVNNLIINALQAMNYKGELEVCVRNEDDLVLLYVSDSGGGIHMDNPRDIFTPFFTTKKQGEGTGLGLNICQQIVDKHQGTINWENTDRGVCFTVALPAGQLLN